MPFEVGLYVHVLVQETCDIHGVSRKAEASTRRVGSAGHKRWGKARKKVSPVGRVSYARYALAFARLKNAGKKMPILHATRTEEAKLVYLQSLKNNSIGFEFLLNKIFIHTVHVHYLALVYLSLHCHVTKSDSCLIKILRYKTEFFYYNPIFQTSSKSKNCKQYQRYM